MRPAEALEEYGRIYNWHAVNDHRGLCPVGWHVSTDEEWTTMVALLGGEDVAEQAEADLRLVQ